MERKCWKKFGMIKIGLTTHFCINRVTCEVKIISSYEILFLCLASSSRWLPSCKKILWGCFENHFGRFNQAFSCFVNYLNVDWERSIMQQWQCTLISISTLTSVGIVVRESHLTFSLFCIRNACSVFAGKAYIKWLATKCH